MLIVLPVERQDIPPAHACIIGRIDSDHDVRLLLHKGAELGTGNLSLSFPFTYILER